MPKNPLNILSMQWLTYLRMVMIQLTKESKSLPNYHYLRSHVILNSGEPLSHHVEMAYLNTCEVNYSSFK